MAQWFFAAALFTNAARAHWLWSQEAAGQILYDINRGGYVGAVLAIFLGLWGTTRIAAMLTAWEARYRGLRLPIITVLRGLYYHAAHYLPVAGFAWLTTGGHAYLVRHGQLAATSVYSYLIVLSSGVILAAVYLFWTYWAAMRNMMYANR
jgi:hypothetical protein